MEEILLISVILLAIMSAILWFLFGMHEITIQRLRNDINKLQGKKTPNIDDLIREW